MGQSHKELTTFEGEMAAPIRADLAPIRVPQRAEPARNLAQRAFFQAALGGSPSVSATAPVRSEPKALGVLPDEPPAKILRPGSLLDIRI